MANLFQTLEIEAFRAGITPRTKESMEWFRKKATSLGRGGLDRKIMKDEAIKLQSSFDDDKFANMYMFYYDPKYKETLPYYDKFPLIIMVGPAKGGFYGLNLHYLSPAVRAKALDALLGNGTVPGKFIKPTIKHYLTKHVKSRFALVEKPEWEIAAFLPTAQFEKARASTVYSNSNRMIK